MGAQNMVLNNLEYWCTQSFILFFVDIGFELNSYTHNNGLNSLNQKGFKLVPFVIIRKGDQSCAL